VEDAGSLPYIVMQYVDGTSLQDRIERTGPLQLAEILRIGVQSARGLAAAHAQGLVHRDVKPANILLENGVERVKITDFGLARAAADAVLTQSGVIAGTPQYMSPEQARGETVDQRSDLFSLGSVLYAMSAGRSPFRAGGSLAVLKRVCEDRPRLLREINPAIPDWLAEIIDKLHSKDPADRFQSAAEVAGLLARHLACLEQPALPVPPRLARPRRGRRKTGVLAVVALLLVAALAVAPQVFVRIKGKDGQVKEIPVPPGGSVEVVLDGQVVAAVPRDPHAPGEIRRFVGHTKALWSVAFSLDGQWAVSGGWDDIIRVWDLETGKELRRFEGHTGPVIRVAFFPDSRRILSAGGDGMVRLWDVGTGKEVRRFEGPAHGVYGLAVSPDGRHALFGGWTCELKDGSKAPVDCALRLVELETGKELRRFEGHTGRVMSVAFSPDGRRALSGANSWNKHGEPHDTVLRLWDVETGKVIRRFEGHTQGVDSVALSADGRLALSGGGDTTVRMWDVETGKELRRFEGHRAMVTGVAFSPDGRRALSGSGDKSLMLWDVVTGQPLHVFEDHIDAVTSVAFSPDGRRALSGSQFRDRTMRLWQLPPPDRSSRKTVVPDP
jgi:WD40 repeat protein